MTRPEFQKVKKGDGLEFVASEHNAMIDAAVANKAGHIKQPRQFSNAAQVERFVVRVRNDHSANLQPFHVLGIKDTDIFQKPTLDLPFFQQNHGFIGVLPTIDHAKSFVVTAQPLKSGKIGRCTIAGLTACQVLIQSLTDEFCEAIPGDITKLKSVAGNGPARILWKDKGIVQAGQVVWCIVQLGVHGGAGAGADVRLAQVKVVSPPGSNQLAAGGTALALFMTIPPEKDPGLEFRVFWEHMTLSGATLPGGTDIVVKKMEQKRLFGSVMIDDWQLINAECEGAFGSAGELLRIAYEGALISPARSVLNFRGKGMRIAQDNSSSLQTDAWIEHNIMKSGSIIGQERDLDFVGDFFTVTVGLSPARMVITGQRNVYEGTGGSAVFKSLRNNLAFHGMATVVDDVANNRVDVDTNLKVFGNGLEAGVRPRINFQNSGSVTWTAVDYAGCVWVTISATSFGGWRREWYDEGIGPLADRNAIDVRGVPVDITVHDANFWRLTVTAFRYAQANGGTQFERPVTNYLGSALVSVTDNVGQNRVDVTYDRHTIKNNAGVPQTNRTFLWFRNNLTVSDDGTNTILDAATGGGGSRHIIQDEGVSLTDRQNLDFRGAVVTATDHDATTTRVTIQAIKDAIHQSNTGFVVTRGTLDLSGTAVIQLSDTGSAARYVIDRTSFQFRGNPLTDQPTVDFTGSAMEGGVSSAGKITYTVDRHTITNNVNTSFANRTWLQFRNNLTVSDVGGVTVIDAAAGSGARHTIQDEGSSLPDKNNLDFRGVTVTATDYDATTTRITVQAVNTFDWNGANSQVRDTLRFSGTAIVNLTGSGTVGTITINRWLIKWNNSDQDFFSAINLTGNAVTVTENGVNDRLDIDINRHAVKNSAGTVQVNRANIKFRNNLTLSDDGTDIIVDAAAGGGAKHVIQDEGTPLTDRQALNFVGAAVAAIDESIMNRTNIVVTAIKDARFGSTVVTRSIIDLAGTAVISIVDSGTSANYTINRHQFQANGNPLSPDNTPVNITGTAFASSSTGSGVTTLTFNKHEIQDHGAATNDRAILNIAGNASNITDTGTRLDLNFNRTLFKNAAGTIQVNRDFVWFRNNLTTTDDGTNLIVDATGSGGSRHVIQEEGVSLPDKQNIDFRGVCVAATDHDATTTRVTLQAIKDARFGSTVVTRSIIDLAGSAVVSLADSGSAASYVIDKHAIQNSAGTTQTARSAIRFRNNITLTDLGSGTNAIAVDAVMALSVKNEGATAFMTNANGFNFVGDIVHASDAGGGQCNVVFDFAHQILYATTTAASSGTTVSTNLGTFSYSHFNAAGVIPSGTPVAASRKSGTADNPEIFAVLCT